MYIIIRNMKILFLTGRESSYPFNQVMIQLMRRFSTVTVPHEYGAGKSILKRSAQVLAAALPEIVSGKYDLIVVGFYGHLLMPPVRAITRTPILFNPFISTYDTLVFDRKKAAPGSVVGRLAFWLDQVACRAADHLLLDTHAHVSYFTRLFHLPPERFSVMPVGSDETMFYPRTVKTNAGHKTVLYYGNYLPLHGVDVIIQAAKLLNDRSNIRFKMLGQGMEYARIQSLVKSLAIHNIDFCPSVPFDKLPDEIAPADICLGGHFGASEKAARVIAGKTYHSLAMGKATIVGDNDANRELLTHQQDAWFSPADDPHALADAIFTLANDDTLREQMGQNAHHTFMQRACLQVLEGQLKQVVEKTIASRRP